MFTPSILSSARCNRASAYQHVFPRDANHVHPWAASRFVNLPLLRADGRERIERPSLFKRVIREKRKRKKSVTRDKEGLLCYSEGRVKKNGRISIFQRGKKWGEIRREDFAISYKYNLFIRVEDENMSAMETDVPWENDSRFYRFGWTYDMDL